MLINNQEINGKKIQSILFIRQQRLYIKELRSLKIIYKN